MHNCSKCSSEATVKINVLFYCDSCFFLLFESKIRRAFPKLNKDANVLLYLSDSRLAAAVADSLIKVLADRRFKRLDIYCVSEELSSQFGLYSLVNPGLFRLHPKDPAVIGYCSTNGYNTIVYLETLDKMIASAVTLLCKGLGTEAISYCATLGDIKTINLLEDIKDNEIKYYLEKKQIHVETEIQQSTDQIFNTITNFIADLDEKNDLALFNVKNTFKKLA